MKAGSLYYHFASKDELLTEILRRGIDVMQTAFDDAEAATGGEAPDVRIGAHVRAHLAALFENGPYTAAHVMTFRTSPEVVRDAVVPLRDAYEARWIDLLVELSAPVASDRAPTSTSRRLALFGAMNSSVEWFDPARGNLDRFAECDHPAVLERSRGMRPIASKIDSSSDRFAENSEHNVVRRVGHSAERRAVGDRRRPGPRALDRAAPVPRQGDGPRPDRHGDRRGHGLHRALATRRLRPVRRRGAGGRHRHGRRRRARGAVDVHRQRRHRQGRIARPDGDQEARPSAGHRPRERPRGDLPGRLRWGVPPAAGRDLPRQGPLRRIVLPAGAGSRPPASRNCRSCSADAPPAARTCRRCPTR